MKFGTYQVSRKGGREKNEDRMGYCYTRDSGLFALADGMGGHPEGEVASQLALQTLAAYLPEGSQDRPEGSAALPAGRDPRRPPPAAALRHRPRPDRHAAHHRRRLRAAGRQRSTGRIAATRACTCVRGDRLIARTRDHSYSELREALSHVVPLDEKVNRNVLFTCLGSPGKPVIDSAGPMVLRTGDRILLCSDGLWSSVEDAGHRQDDVRLPDPRLGARARGAGAAQRRREERQRHRAGRRMGSVRGRRQPPATSPRARWARTCSRRPSRPA